MTCYTRCGNGCCPNTPNPIWVFGQCNQGSNNVVNPITALSYGYFQAPTTGEVTTNTAIPLTLTTSRGTLITSGGADSVSLDAGTYLITYSVNALVPASGTLSTSLQLNDNCNRNIYKHKNNRPCRSANINSYTYKFKH